MKHLPACRNLLSPCTAPLVPKKLEASCRLLRHKCAVLQLREFLCLPADWRHASGAEVSPETWSGRRQLPHSHRSALPPTFAIRPPLPWQKAGSSVMSVL